MFSIKRNSSFLDSQAHIYVCPVNCGGIMGCGVALHFKNRMSSVGLQDYYRACKNGDMYREGCIVVEGSYKIGRGAPIALLATKRVWQEGGDLNLIKRALKSLKERATDMMFINDMDELIISMPAIGCGRAGLNLDDVIPLVEDVFGEEPNIRVEFYVLE